MNDFAEKSYHKNSSTGLMCLVGFVVGVFLTVAYVQYQKEQATPMAVSPASDMTAEPSVYKWWYRHCEIRLVKGEKLVPCSAVTDEQYNSVFLEYRNPYLPYKKGEK